MLNASALLSAVKRNGHLLGIAAAVLLVHTVNSLFTTYGLFRDELYYIVCSDNPAFGYVDHPPLSAILLMISRTLFGDSIIAIRLFPSAAHAATVFCTGMLARKLGGGKPSQIFAAILIAFAPGIIGMFGFYSMNAVEILLWSLTFLCILQLIETNDPKFWIIIGTLIGFGLMNKISMGWLAAGLAAGSLLTPMRRWLMTRWPWYAAGIAALIFLPYILWNLQHDWAHLEFARNAARFKYASQSPLTFLSGLVDRYNPLALPVLLAGFYLLLFRRKNEGRIIGIIVATVLIILLVNINSKSEYFNPAAVVLLAAGTVQWEQWSAARFRWVVPVYTAVILLTGIMILPLALDLLPPDRMISYMRTLGVEQSNAEGKKMGALPQHFADRFGWKELTKNVADVYRALDEQERPLTSIYVRNYGEASAIAHFGKQYGLPQPLSGHNNYWIWGNDRLRDTVEVLIALGGTVDDYSDAFSDIRLAGTHTAPFVMPYEDNIPIYVCRKPRLRIKEVWHTTKHYD
jgi:hypothetical protein